MYLFVLFAVVVQTERAYQKQRPIFQNHKSVLVSGGKKKEQRFTRNVGLGFKIPREVRNPHQ